MADEIPNDAGEFSTLRDQLTLCAALYGSDNSERQRQAIFSALFAVTDFLQTKDFPPETLLPLMRPAIALAQLQDNIIDSLFAQRARGGRPKIGIEDLERAGILAAFANAWLHIHKDDPLDQRSKLSAAARAMRGGWFRDVNRQKLKSARDMVNQEGKDHPSVIIAKEFERLFDEAFQTVGSGKAFQTMVHFVNRSPPRSLPEILKTPPVSVSRES